ncbi:MAG: hypothetical protein Q8S73_40755 [Deltaproteobacteria bacterium]|nr:hypothetical protein [Myxococcales bacterium]MDP3220494.1 hypothetical protein [Deltaproteobacteria bacterium]
MATTRTATGARKLIEATKRDALAARHKKLTSLSALIRRRLATVVESFYDIGVALTEIAKTKLYAADGHASLEAYLDAEKLLSVSQARKLIDIVKNIPRDQALAVGQERAYALIALSRATPEPDSAVDLIAQGEVDGQPAAKAPVRAITAAARAQREKAPKTPAAKARRKTEVALERGLRALLRAAGLSVTAVRISKDAVRVELPRAKVEKALAKA